MRQNDERPQFLRRHIPWRYRCVGSLIRPADGIPDPRDRSMHFSDGPVRSSSAMVRSLERPVVHTNEVVSADRLIDDLLGRRCTTFGFRDVAELRVAAP